MEKKFESVVEVIGKDCLRYETHIIGDFYSYAYTEERAEEILWNRVNDLVNIYGLNHGLEMFSLTLIVLDADNNYSESTYEFTWADYVQWTKIA